MNDAIDELVQVIRARRDAAASESYTARLFSQGPVEIAKKVGEEGVEVVAAALAQSDERVVSEVADLVYHVLVLLASRGLEWDAVLRELEKRRRP